MTIMTKVTGSGSRFLNPYNAQGPTNPKYYANREELLSTFIHSVVAVSESGGVTRPINLAVMGSWGVGKTSTLLKFRDMIRHESGQAPIFSSCVSLSPNCCTDAETFFVYIMESVFREYESTAPLPRKVLDFIKEELNVFEKWKLSKISANPEIERRDPVPVRGINFKETMVKFWEKLEAGGIRLAIVMLDDIHYALPRGNGQLLYDLRTAMQALSAAGTQYMFIITGPVNLYPEMRDKAEPFTRLFERFDLRPFDLEGARQLIEKPLQAESIDLIVEEPVVRRIYEITGGHPYFLTLTMRDVLEQVRKGRLTPARFDLLCPELVGHFARLKFRDDLERASEAERKLLFQMAGAPGEAVSPSELTGSGTTRLLDRLVKKELVVKVARGKYRLYNPLFQEYLKSAKLLAD